MKEIEDISARLFINYLIEGDLQKAERILDKANRPLQNYNSRESPVHMAVSRGDVAAVDFLFRKGFDLNEPDFAIHGGTVVHRCVANGDAQMLLYLLDKKNYLDLDAVDAMGRTPLHIACIHSYEDIAHTLINVGVSLTLKDRDGKPPRYYADTGRLASVAARLPSFKYNWEGTAKQKLEEARVDLLLAPVCSSNKAKRTCKYETANMKLQKQRVKKDPQAQTSRSH